MFYVKKILEQCFYPLSIILVLLFIGIILLYCRKFRLGRLFVLIGSLLLLIATLPWVPNLLVNSLQYQYPPLARAPNTTQYIAVLGAGILPMNNIPINNLPTTSSMQRILEAIRLWQQVPQAKIIFSGGSDTGQFNDGDYMAKTAEMLGVPNSAIIRENQSLDTAEEAVLIKKIVGNAPFILVTSAYHMPRSMELFEHQGMRPVAAACDFQYTGKKHLLELLPSTYNIAKLQIAIHEYQGLAWNTLTGK